MGVVSACFGGIIRDLLGQSRSIIFSREIYVTAALGAAVAYVGLNSLGFAREVTVLIGVVVGLVLRGGALLWGWSLPHHQPRPTGDKPV
jgi:uncharacterized membrane protein YeiH